MIIADADTTEGRFASGLSDDELAEMERFASLNGLSNLARLCMEVRQLRSIYLQQCAELGRLRGQVRR